MTHAANGTKPLNILLVEDDDGDAMAVARAFKAAKIANPITRAIAGIEALELLRSGDRTSLASPFVILLDQNMPRMNGHEFLAELRRDPALRRLTVFMLSTSSDRQDIEAAYDQNVAGYIVKDTAGEDFLDLAGTLESFWKVIEVL